MKARVINFLLSLSMLTSPLKEIKTSKCVEQENDPHLNEKQNEETVLKEGKLFHVPNHYIFPKKKNSGSRSIVSKIFHGYIMMKGT